MSKLKAGPVSVPLAALILLLPLLLGCPVRSIFPLFTDAETVFEPGLVGLWSSADGDKLSFEKAGDKGQYTVTATEEGPDGEIAETRTYIALLGRLGKALFLDMSVPVREGEEGHVIPTHTIWRVWLETDALRMVWLDDDWLGQMIEGKKITIAHFRRGDEIVLTAPTAELQALVKRFADDIAAFPDPERYFRMK